MSILSAILLLGVTIFIHELGHLLGLFHTRGADQLMDDTRSAWDLVGESKLDRAPLAETVFPMGMEDPGAVLARSVGRAETP
jgi:hypothetical protein